MREYMQRKQTWVKENQPKASQQASAAEVLQTYKKRMIQMQAMDEDELLQGKFETAQKEGLDEEEILQAKFETAQREESISMGAEETNNTGLPDNLKSGIENLSGYSMDNVRVHYNSDKPAQLQALAYTQGTDIHVAPGQEQYLPHEAWHVVQQMQGRVQPTTQLQGVNINDNEGLEKEADVMGGKIVQKRESVHNRPLHKSNCFQFSAIREKANEGSEEVRVGNKGDCWKMFVNVVKKTIFEVSKWDEEAKKISINETDCGHYSYNNERYDLAKQATGTDLWFIL